MLRLISRPEVKYGIQAVRVATHKSFRSEDEAIASYIEAQNRPGEVEILSSQNIYIEDRHGLEQWQPGMATSRVYPPLDRPRESPRETQPGDSDQGKVSLY